MRKTIATLMTALTIVLTSAPLASATMAPSVPPSEPAPSECAPWIDPMTVQIEQYREGIAFLLHTEDQLFATISTQRDQIAELNDTVQMRDWKIRQQARAQRHQQRVIRREHRTIRRLRAELAAANEES